MTNTLQPAHRLLPIDLLRGIVMIIMALDHVRDYFHITAMTADPLDPATTTPVLFFTRFITHFCAPVFVFLAGTSVFLAGQKLSKQQLSALLLKRGLVLMLMEIVIFNLLFSFDPLYRFLGLQVIWVTGLSMVLMSGLIYLRLRTLFIIGLIVVAGHNLLDHFNSKPGEVIPLWWGILHQQYFANYAPGRFFGVMYPLLPWPGVMILGYCLGSWYTSADPAQRIKLLKKTGLLVTLAFFILRWVNIYGDPNPWTSQHDHLATVLSFFNVTKYPPSLQYLCITIGPALILLAWLEKAKGAWTNIVVVYGRVPMFYYLLHFFLIHVLCTIAFLLSGRPMADAFTGMMAFRPNDFGFSLGVVYLIWIFVVAVLYKPCKWYGQYKAAHRKWWLTYL
ncbi:DUF1624 domain-containing protein [Sediminibacterium ginsengisoli]|uniref:Uncharacterized membrane protein n=1 Tax=Sediminibacterium ginsengisoli TaxID=413434 RepID=A0A1T4QX23_9BACT|nr:heparan-alpha-glucosaminide N-acetyltransferase domain-containing protein [Sediminibacterium ginsengisoli]SKA08001.1 Uncharacterized membrane protein [Sediminibacterium ginsengisoli]